MDWMAISSGSITSCPSANLKNKNYRYTFFFSLAIIKYTCTLGWVNLYQKFELEKYTVRSKLISKKWKGVFFKFWHNWLANLHGFAKICKLPVSNTFKDMQSKI